MKKLPVTLTASETYIGWCYWALQLLVLPPALSVLVSALGLKLSDAQTNFILFSLNFICLSVILHRFLIRSGKIALQRPIYVLQSAFLGYGVYWLSTLALNYIIAVFLPGFRNINDSSIMAMVQQSYPLMVISTVFLVPLSEELLYRGLIFDRLHATMPAAAFAVSTLFFSAIHVLPYIGRYDLLTLAVCFVQYIPPGLCLCWAYVRSGTIWAPIIMHMAVNQTTILTLR